MENVRIYKFGELPPFGHWYIRDNTDNGSAPCQYAIVGPSGAVEAWTDYPETARLIVWTLALNNQPNQEAKS